MIQLIRVIDNKTNSDWLTNLLNFLTHSHSIRSSEVYTTDNSFFSLIMRVAKYLLMFHSKMHAFGDDIAVIHDV